MCKYEIPSAAVEANSFVRIDEIFTHSMVRQVTIVCKYPLFDGPRIRAKFQHFGVVVGFQYHTVTASKVPFDENGQMTQVRRYCELRAVGAEGKTNGIHRVVGDLERMDLDVTYREVLAGLDLLDTPEPFAEGVWEDT